MMPNISKGMVIENPYYKTQLGESLYYFIEQL